MRIDDYAVVGDAQTVALVGKDGSIDWLCFPRFDSPACFGALLGTAEHGRWKLAPCGEVTGIRRRYRGDTLVLETELDTADGTVRLVDFMPLRGRAPDVVRIVEGVRGRVQVSGELTVRFEYGDVAPWIRRSDGRVHAAGGPDALVLATPIATYDDHQVIRCEFFVDPGDRVPFVLTWHPSWEDSPPSPDPFDSLTDTVDRWQAWSSRCQVRGRYRDAVMRSLLTLKALTYAPSGGIVAAGTTSLPENLGGRRNWDYRYCWLRDATFTLEAMLHAGYEDEARAWRDWLLRTIAGDPQRLQILYGVGGEHHVREHELDWLPGYEGSKPVRVGNGAVGQRQLDVYGEVIEMLYQARSHGIAESPVGWDVARALLDWLEHHWPEPDEGMWEIRADRENFTFSKVMTWAAFDRAVKAVEQFGASGPVERWRQIRDRVHADVCESGFDRARNTFTQAYGSAALDASLLRLPIVGFLPGDDPRVTGTIRAIERELMEDGFVLRYRTTPDKQDNIDGMPGRDSAFIACSFWLVDALLLAGRRRDARTLFERLLKIRNDVGLLSEEYDTRRLRLVGNFPQAFSHVALVNSARRLEAAGDHE